MDVFNDQAVESRDVQITVERRSFYAEWNVSISCVCLLQSSNSVLTFSVSVVHNLLH